MHDEVHDHVALEEGIPPREAARAKQRVLHDTWLGVGLGSVVRGRGRGRGRARGRVLHDTHDGLVGLR